SPSLAHSLRHRCGAGPGDAGALCALSRNARRVFQLLHRIHPAARALDDLRPASAAGRSCRDLSRQRSAPVRASSCGERSRPVGPYPTGQSKRGNPMNFLKTAGLALALSVSATAMAAAQEAEITFSLWGSPQEGEVWQQIARAF